MTHTNHGATTADAAIYDRIVARRRLHKSTIVVALLSLAVITLIIAPGNQTDMYLARHARFDHGWPWMFLQRDVFWGSPWWNQANRDVFPVQPIGDVPWLSLPMWKFWQGEVKNFSALNLAWDFAVALAIVGGPAVAWEWRRRRRTSAWQFRLSEMFAATTLIVAGAGWFAWQHGEHTRELPHYDALDPNDGLYVFDACVAPQWIQRLVGLQILPDYLWRADLLSVTIDVDASIDIDASNDKIRHMLPHLQQLRRLQTIEINDVDVSSRVPFTVLARLPRLRTLDLSFWDDLSIGFEEAVELANLQQLTKLIVDKRSNITHKAQDVIRQKMPHCTVEYVEDILNGE